MDRGKIEKLIHNFKLRNIDVEYYEKLNEVTERIEAVVDVNSTIGIGNSKTLKKMQISKILKERGNIVYDKTMAKTKEEINEIKKKSLITDCYITGSNAISVDGYIVNIDHSGNRVAAMIYGPEKVIVVVGKNKICETLKEATDRARNIAAPLNAKRAGYNPPCLELKKCVDCKGEERVCFNSVIIEGQHKKGRMKLFIVNEDVGF